MSTATVVLRIPSEGFASILTQLRALGEIATEPTAARLASAKVLEQRLLELAAERTGTVEHLLAVERELAATEPGLGRRISDGFTSSIEALRDFGGGLAIAFVAFLPWLVLAIPAFFLGRRAWRRHLARRIPYAIAQQPQQQPAPPPAEHA